MIVLPLREGRAASTQAHFALPLGPGYGIEFDEAKIEKAGTREVGQPGAIG